MNQLNFLVTGQHELALTVLHWVHVIAAGALLYSLIKGFHALKPINSWWYKFLEWGVVLTLSAYIAALVTNSAESKTSVQDLIEPWVFLALAVGAGYSVSKWPEIAQESIKQEEKPERVYWRFAPQAGGLLVAGLFSMGLLSSGINDVRQGQQQEIATDSTAARQAIADRKENAELKKSNDSLAVQLGEISSLVAQVLIVAQTNSQTMQMSAEDGAKREAMLKELSNQMKRYQQMNYRRTVPTPNPIKAQPFKGNQTSQAEQQSDSIMILQIPVLAQNPE